MRFVLAAGAFGAALFFAAPSAHACSCAPPPDAAAAFQGSTFVFQGTAGATTQPTAEGDGPMSNFAPKTVAFTVVDSYKGGLSGSVNLKTAGNSAACGRSYNEGETYLIYASKNEAGEPFDTLCTRTRPLKGNAADVTVLEGLKAETPETPAQTGGDDKGEATAGDTTAPSPGDAGEGSTGDTQAGETGGEATADAGDAQGTDAPKDEAPAAGDPPKDDDEGGKDEPKECSTADATPSWALLALLPLLGRIRRR